MKNIGFAIMAVGVLVFLGGIMVMLLATKEQKEEQTEESRIVAKQDLHAFTLLNQNHLQLVPGKNPDENAPKVEDFTGRCLLVNVKHSAEVKKEMVSSEDSKTLLSDAVEVNIPGTAKTFVGGQLRTGDLVDLVTVSTKDTKEVNKFETLMVLRIGPANKDTALPDVITLAIPSSQRESFASAIVGAELLVTRKIR